MSELPEFNDNTNTDINQLYEDMNEDDIEYMRQINEEYVREQEILRGLNQEQNLGGTENLLIALCRNFEKGSKLSESRSQLANLLESDLGLVHESEIKGLNIDGLIDDYYIQTKNNVLKKVSFGELYTEVIKYLTGVEVLTSTVSKPLSKFELKKVLSYIPDSYREYNKITFNNGIYDLKEHRFISKNEIVDPVLTHKRVPYNYNPKAKGEKVKEFLRYAFDKYNPSYDSDNKDIKAFYEIGGYSFYSGNPEQKIVFMPGLSNTGKSLSSNLLKRLHNDNASSVPCYKFSDPHATSGLINKSINMGKDIRNELIEDNSEIKIASGNEPVPINPKHKNLAEIPAQEVPLTIDYGNWLPKFKNLESALVNRILILNFKNIVPRNNHPDDQYIIEDLKEKKEQLKSNHPDWPELPIPFLNSDLENEIINDDSEMEFLIYQCLEHDKKRLKNGGKFSIQKNRQEIENELVKHSEPIQHLLDKHYVYDDSLKDNGVLTTDVYEKLRHEGRAEGIDIEVNNKSLGKKVCPAFRELFDLDQYWESKVSKKYLDNHNKNVQSTKSVKIYLGIKNKNVQRATSLK